MKRSWIEVSAGQLKRNIQSLHEATSAKVIFVVKADAYGHGLVPIARSASETGINWFAVAYLDEALALRDALPNIEILVLGYVSPGHVERVLKNKITPIITDRDHGLALAAAARALGKTLPAHLKIDTGMGRLGVQWDQAEETVKALDQASGLKLIGVCSHFSKVDVDPKSSDEARVQVEKFKQVLNVFPSPIFTHLSSSRAALYFPEWDFDAIRQGIVLYGYGGEDLAGRFQTQPILQWKACVAQVKGVPAGFSVGYYGTYRTEASTQLATLAVGYADGYNRALSNCGHVLIHSKRCAVVGRVSMNWITVDVGPDTDVQVGDEAVLIGQQGSESIWANELATLSRTIPYEILTSIHASLERKYTA